MEEGLARVSWYERQLLIGPNHIFHRLLMEGRESFKRGCVILYTFGGKLVDNLLCLCNCNQLTDYLLVTSLGALALSPAVKLVENIFHTASITFTCHVSNVV